MKVFHMWCYQFSIICISEWNWSCPNSSDNYDSTENDIYFKIQQKYIIINTIRFIFLWRNYIGVSTEQSWLCKQNTKCSETQIIWTLNLWKYEFCNPVFVATKGTFITYASISYVMLSVFIICISEWKWSCQNSSDN